ncbi:MAG TPA: hypothetical protein EYN91_11150 [Candidatus Melainabacteria bacterium]|jgi:hypothetical protein|nr:hypothetical protein [Candidatus Melainabacteria bacterium]HIN65422.1 hypothetical protein [Candidatus Obscuribacterales bacterium]
MTDTTQQAQGTGHIRIGELLMQSEILSSDFIRDALERFEQRGLPIGKVLVMSGYLTEAELRQALEVQSLVNDGHLPLELGVTVLRVAHKEHISLNDAFQRSGLVQPEDQETNRLGQLLVAAGIVTDRDLEEALQINVRTGLPLGHVFCFHGYVSQALLYTALQVQESIRRNAIGRPEAIAGLNAAAKRERNLERLEINKGYQKLPMKQALRLGEMLVEARVFVDKLLPDALVRSLQFQKPIGEILVQSHFATPELIDAAVEMQEMIDNGCLLQNMANEVLLNMRASDVSFAKALGQACTFRHRNNLAKILVELLAAAQAVTLTKLTKDIQERLEVNYNQINDVSKQLLEHELVDPELLFAGMRCVYLIDVKFINLEQATIILEIVGKTHDSVDNVLHTLGWTARTRLREPKGPQ